MNSTMAAPNLFSSMDFPAFVAWRREQRAQQADLIDVAETRIGQALAPLRPSFIVPDSFPRVHRCHLAPVWCELRGMPPKLAPRAFACEGVRHGLELLLRAFANSGRRVAMPGDVYPVYWRIAAAAEVETSALDTFPDFDLARLLAQATSDGASVVLLPAPLKLHGRAWTAEEIDVAARWLAQDGERRLVLDGVYAFGQSLDPAMLRLIETDQVFYLDSLSKGWLHELVFGMVLVPERDRASLQDIFRALHPTQRQLFQARELMARFHEFPARLADELGKRRTELMQHLTAAGVKAQPAAQGYLIVLPANTHTLLADHRVLALPASVFGSARTDFSIASALPPEVLTPP
jgi:aspartate/methionine/tyrosine aminotransferase